MDCKLANYNLNQNENQFYIFELKVKDINEDKFTIRRIKQEKQGNLINSTDEINKLSIIKINIFDLNDPTNVITIKRNISNDVNLLLRQNNILIQIINTDYVTVNYRFI